MMTFKDLSVRMLHGSDGFLLLLHRIFRLFKNPMLITMSISDAPLVIASFVSDTFVAVVLYPFGNPITVQIGSFPSTYSAACFTYAAGIHAEAVSYLIPSSESFDIFPCSCLC